MDQLQPVEASNIAAVGYGSNQVIRVLFKDGSEYEYFPDIPEAVFMKFVASKFKGHFLDECIKPHYHYRKIKKPEERWMLTPQPPPAGETPKLPERPKPTQFRTGG